MHMMQSPAYQPMKSAFRVGAVLHRDSTEARDQLRGSIVEAFAEISEVVSGLPLVEVDKLPVLSYCEINKL